MEAAPDAFGGTFTDAGTGVVVVWSTEAPSVVWEHLRDRRYEPPAAAIEVRQGRYGEAGLEALADEVAAALAAGELADLGVFGVGPHVETNGIELFADRPVALDVARLRLGEVAPDAAPALTTVVVASRPGS